MNKTFALVLFFQTIFFLISCNNVTDGNDDLSASLNPIAEVVPIAGGENSTVIVNTAQQAYFNIEFRDVGSNNVIGNNVFEGWCIDWQKPINSDNGVYDGIRLYSTFGVEKWMPLNYFLNIIDDLKADDPSLTHREFQVVIWELRGFPEFNMNEIDISDFPNRMVTNGEYNFDPRKVRDIVELVNAEYEDFEFEEGTRFAVIAEMPVDVQTLIAVTE